MPVFDKPFTNLQLELLRLFSLDLSDEQLLRVKEILSKHFAEQASDEMDRLWKKNKWSNETMDSWLSDTEEGKK